MNAVAEPVTIERAAIDGGVHIPCTLIQASRTNPRKRFDDSYIASLAESIKKVGVFQPIVVRPLAGRVTGGPQYELVAGECRWRATQKAGLEQIPAGFLPVLQQHGERLADERAQFTAAATHTAEVFRSIRRG